ncbi:hypothetical protein JCM6882_002012 [Rhodosporidiobolus microsporus]
MPDVDSISPSAAAATAGPTLPTQPSFVHLSDAEKASGKWTRANMQRAVEILHRDGLLAISNAVDLAHVDKLRESMMQTAKEIKAAAFEKGVAAFNHGLATNFLMSAPLADPELRFEDVFSNPFIVAIVEAYLGPNVNLTLLTANCALANTTERQPVHKDAPWLHPNAPYMLNTNLALSDFTPENGSTEFWLGSHAGTTAWEQLWPSADSLTPLCDVNEKAMEERRRMGRPGAQVRVPAGTVTLRDMRTWHAGMPNTTDEDRIMTAVGYSAAWFPEPERKEEAPESARPLLTRLTNTYLNFIPDDQWLAKCQNWDLNDPDAIRLPDVPGHRKTKQAPGEETEWVALNEVVPTGVRFVKGEKADVKY